MKYISFLFKVNVSTDYSVLIKTKNCKIIIELHKQINRQIRVITHSKKYHSIVTFIKTVESAYIVLKNLDTVKSRLFQVSFTSSLVYLKSSVSCISSFTLPFAPHYLTVTWGSVEHSEEVWREAGRCIRSVWQLRKRWEPLVTWNKQDSLDSGYSKPRFIATPSNQMPPVYRKNGGVPTSSPPAWTTDYQHMRLNE